MKICPKCQTKFNQNESFCSKDGSKLQDLTPEKKGALSGGTLDKVARLERLLNVDAMAERYLGVLVEENQPTWITVFNQQFVLISDAKKRMETARSLVGAPLPKEINIALRSNFDHTPSYIVHSEPAGPSVRELLEKEERLPWELATKIIASTARVLEWLHEHGILFRAIHPGAIYVSDIENGKVQIAEWAYDSLMDIDSPLEALKEDESAFVGYVDYLAPELAEGFERGDVRSTVYALGILLYEMITGIAPMKAATPAETLSRHKLEKPLPIQLAAPNAKFHPDLSEILDRMLSKKKENRFQAPGTIIAVLSNLLGTTPLELAPKLTRNSDMREDELFQTIDMESVDRSSIPALAPLKKEVQEIKKTMRMNAEAKRKTLMMQSVSGTAFDAKPSIEVNFGDEEGKSIEVNFDAPASKPTMHFINPVLEAPAEDTKKREEEDAAKKRDDEKAAKKREEEDAAKKREEEDSAKKRDDEKAAKKREEEDAAKKREEEDAAKKRADEKAAKKREDEVAAAKRKEETEAKKQEEKEAAKQRKDKKAGKKRKDKKAAQKRKEEKEVTPKKTVHFIKKKGSTDEQSSLEVATDKKAVVVVDPDETVSGMPKPMLKNGAQTGGDAPDAEWFSTSKDEAWERSFEREGDEESKTQQKRIGVVIIIGVVLASILAVIYINLYQPDPDPSEVIEAEVPKGAKEVPKVEETKEKGTHLATKFSEALSAGRFIAPLGNSASSYLEQLSILAPDSADYRKAKSEFSTAILEKSKAMPIETSMNLLREAKKLDPENEELETRFAVLNTELAGTEKVEKAEEIDKEAEKKEDVNVKTEPEEKVKADKEKEKTAPKEKANASELIKKAKSAYVRNQTSAAKKLYLEAYAIAPSDHRVTGGLGAIYFDQGNYAKSVSYFTKAVGRSGSVKYRISLGQSYYRLGRYKSAIKAWKSALKKSPNNKSAKSYIKLAERKLR